MLFHSPKGSGRSNLFLKMLQAKDLTVNHFVVSDPERDACRQAFNLPILRKEELEEYLKLRDTGGIEERAEALHVIAIHNMRLGWKYVNKILSQENFWRTGNSDDLWQEIYILLYNAAAVYDPKKGAFSTFADTYLKHWARWQLQKLSRETRIVANIDQMRDTEGDGEGMDSILDRLAPDISKAEDKYRIAERDRDVRRINAELYDVIGHALTEKEAYILLRHAGFYNDGKPPATKEIARDLGVSEREIQRTCREAEGKAQSMVSRSFVNGRPRYPLLLRYWEEVSPGGLYRLLRPVMVEDYPDEEEDILAW